MVDDLPQSAHLLLGEGGNFGRIEAGNIVKHIFEFFKFYLLPGVNFLKVQVGPLLIHQQGLEFSHRLRELLDRLVI